MTPYPSAALVAAMAWGLASSHDAGAQSVAPPGAPGPASAPLARAAAPAITTQEALVYRSAFEGYRGHRPQPVESWRLANDRVGEIGGWQAYARETLTGAPAGAASAASGASTGAHSGHKTR